MILILICLVPFAVLMSAIMIAVCSYARTFKEAQNYVTPVILAVLIPGGIAALPATRLEGVMLAMPVGNMVLLARDFLVGTAVPVWQIALVLLSTSLYAAAAVAVAANVFGKESVVFADSGSLASLLSRRTFKPTSRPSISTGLLVVSLLFPVWFMLQSTFSPGPEEDATGLLYATGLLMPLLFVFCPALVMWHGKVNILKSLALRVPSRRFLMAGLLIGATAWIPAHELTVLQASVIGLPKAVLGSNDLLAQTMTGMPVMLVFLLIAVVPAFCEELLFRGFLLSSLRPSLGKWSAILVCSAVFGIFHFWLFKFAVTSGLGVMLAYLCWQSRSILPGMLAHFLHNSLGVLSVVSPETFSRLGISQQDELAHLPPGILVVGGAIFVAGCLVATRAGSPDHSMVASTVPET